MGIWRLLYAVVVLALGTTLLIAAGPPAYAATPGVACFGSTACVGQSPVSAGCTSNEQLLEILDVTGVGHLSIYENSICGTAWASLKVDDTATPDYPEEVASGNGILIAELLYEPALGGPEQYDTVPWDDNLADTVTTNMVPLGGSFKACAGSPDLSGHPFDMAPQGSLETVQNPAASTTPLFSLGGCTFWH